MRRFALVLLACILALGMSAGVGKLITTVHAATSACNSNEQEGTIYSQYKSGSQFVFDSVTQTYHQVGFDLAAYEYGQFGTCLRSYYTSAWTYDHALAQSITAHLRVWVCGAPAADFQQVTYNDWGRAVVAYYVNQVWPATPNWPLRGGIELNTNTPDGHTWVLGYADYTNTPCGPQADNQITSVVNSNWSPSPAYVYLNF